MKIHDDHLYHGAALLQIAEHPEFTAINPLELGERNLRVAYKVNDNIAIYLKYATRPTGRYKEYVFTFSAAQLADIYNVRMLLSSIFIALVCVADREVCCLSEAELRSMVMARESEIGDEEDSVTVLVSIQQGKSLRAYVNVPGQRKGEALEVHVVPRGAFPAKLFA